jgi:hypothetical protein
MPATFDVANAGRLARLRASQELLARKLSERGRLQREIVTLRREVMLLGRPRHGQIEALRAQILSNIPVDRPLSADAILKQSAGKFGRSTVHRVLNEFVHTGAVVRLEVVPTGRGKRGALRRRMKVFFHRPVDGTPLDQEMRARGIMKKPAAPPPAVLPPQGRPSVKPTREDVLAVITAELRALGIREIETTVTGARWISDRRNPRVLKHLNALAAAGEVVKLRSPKTRAVFFHRPLARGEEAPDPPRRRVIPSGNACPQIAMKISNWFRDPLGLPTRTIRS